MNKSANRVFPAADCAQAVEIVADYLTSHALPADAGPDLLVAVKDAWMVSLRTVSPARHPRFPEYVVVHEAVQRNGLAYAVHVPTGLVFPAHAHSGVADMSWLGDIDAALNPSAGA